MAIVIRAPDEDSGVAQEYAWLATHEPQFRLRQQALIECGGRPVDRMEGVDGSDKARTFFFDISYFFGRFEPNDR